MGTDKILNEAVKKIGPEINGNLEKELYDFIRRYNPMVCVDIVIVPSGDKPKVILAKRNRTSVAPGQWWIFGGRVDKKIDYVKTATNKIEKECGLKVELGFGDIIGIGSTYFSKEETNEEEIRDYDISTTNICFRKNIELNQETKEKINPAEGHDGEWKIFEEIDSSWHPYIIHCVASAWASIFGEERIMKMLNEDVKKILKEKGHLIPLRYNPFIL